MALLLAPVIACSGSDRPAERVEPPARSEDARPDEPSTTRVDPNDVMVDCLLRRGVDVRRAGDVDGQMNGGVSYGENVGGDPQMAIARSDCEGLANAAARGEDGVPSEAAARASFDAYMAAMTTCMLDHGFHLTLLGHPYSPVSGDGRILTYPPGETDDPGFLDAQTQCIEAASEAD